MLKKSIFICLGTFCFSVHSVSVHLSVCFSVSDELRGIAGPGGGLCDWYSSEQWSPRAGQDDPAWQNRLAIRWLWVILTQARSRLALKQHSGPV